MVFIGLASGKHGLSLLAASSSATIYTNKNSWSGWADSNGRLASHNRLL